MKGKKKVSEFLKAFFFWLCINCYFFLAYGTAFRPDEKRQDLGADWQGFKGPFWEINHRIRLRYVGWQNAIPVVF